LNLTPLDKQSKRNKKEHHARQRGSWHGVNPVTRKSENAKMYDRKKEKRLLRGERFDFLQKTWYTFLHE